MHGRPPTKRRRLVAVVAVVIVVAVVVVLAGRGGEQDAEQRLRSVGGVAAVRGPTVAGGTRTVRLDEDVSAGAVREVLAALPPGDDAILTVGRTRLTTRARSPDPALAEPFVALVRLREPAREVALDDTGGVAVRVDRREQAAPIGRAVVAALAPRGRWPENVDGVRVRLSRSPSTVDPLLVALEERSMEGRSVPGALDAAVALGDRLGRLVVAGRRIELRVRVRGVADADDAWRASARRLGAAAEDVTLYLDPEGPGGVTNSAGPLLSGGADQSPSSALRLLRALDAAADRPFVSAPPTFAHATVGRLADGGRVAAIAGRAGVRRLQLTASVADGTWLDGTELAEPDDLPELRDAPATVLRLVRSAPRLARAGLAMSWTEASFGIAEARFARPGWLDEDADLLEDAVPLRRLATAIRGADWPGRARFVLPLGPGSCGDDADEEAEAAVTITSTARGRAAKVEAVGSDCDDGTAASAVRRAWNATAG
jgi:hypothetical protein